MSNAALQAGIDALKNGDAKAAVNHLVMVLVQNPEDAQAHAYLGMAYGQIQMPEKSLDHLRRAANFAPQNPSMRFNLGTALEQAGQPAEAVVAYQNTLS